jgi:hypothetical protein
MSSVITSTSSTVVALAKTKLSTWRARIAVALLIVLTSLAMLLWWRMCRGALLRPLPLVGLLGFAILLPGVAMLIRNWYPRRSQPEPITATQQLSGYIDYLQEYLLPSLLCCVIAVALTNRGSHPLGITLLWSAVGLDTLGVLVWPRVCMLLGIDRQQSSTLTTPKVESPATVESTEESNLLYRLHEPDLHDEPAAELEQTWLFAEPHGLLEMRRWQTETGEQYLSGACRFVVQPGQRVVIAHTVLHPIWPTTPRVAIEQSEPAEIEIRAVQTIPQGIRWEIRLPEVAEVAFPVTWSFVIE